MPEPGKAAAQCPVNELMQLLSGPWTTYVIHVLRTQGPHRFGELKRKVGGVSAKMLTERLRLLEAAEAVYRHYEPTVPPQVTYGLTERGHELGRALDPLAALALKWRAETISADAA